MKSFEEMKLLAMAKINKNREDAKKIADKNFSCCLRQYPQIREIYELRRSLVKEIAKERYNNWGETSQIKYDKLSKELKTLVSKLGIKKEDITPNYKCKKCGDKGIVDGKFCECLHNEIYTMQMENNGFKLNDLPKFSNVDFEIIKDDTNKQEQVNTYKLLNTLLETKQIKYKIITMFGGVGVGKTNMLQCVCERAIDLDFYTIYTTSFDLNSTMLKYHCSKIDEKQDILQPYLNADILCIDDLGTENHINNVTTEYYYLILNERINRGKITFITTNLNLEQIRDLYDDRIFSRMCSGINALKLYIKGDDLRLKIKSK